MKIQNYIKVILILAIVVVFIVSIIFLILPLCKKASEPAKIPEYVSVQYCISDSVCGNITGETYQRIEKGEDTTPVTVVPNLGYKFLGWVSIDNQDEYFDEDKFTRQDTNVQNDLIFIAKFVGPVDSVVKFNALKGGTVEGTLYQKVIYGGKGEPVTAIPDEGYRFVKWSDGETEAVRENLALCRYGDPDIYAEFERYSRKFEYVYNDGESEDKQTEIEITLDNITELTLPVPTRENCKFEGWYSDWHHTSQVADDNGQMLVDADWLDKDFLYTAHNPEGYLYAKWSPLIEVPTYKILMIFVTEVHGDFVAGKMTEPETLENIRVDYIMSDAEKQVANKLVEYIGEYLKAILNARINFEVDAYFTTQSMTEENFIRGVDSNGYGDYSIGNNKYDTPKQIPEVADLVDEYDSILTSHCLCGYENSYKLTRNTAGGAVAKYGHVAWETIVSDRSQPDSSLTVEDLLDMNNPYTLTGWESGISTYIHEFTHTVEMKSPDPKYFLHNILNHYGETNGPYYSAYAPMIQYLSGFYEIDGENVGIPYDFWLGKFD